MTEVGGGGMRRGTVVGVALVAGLVLALVVLAVVGWTRFSTVHPTADELAALPGADATYPGTAVYLRAALDGDRNVMATNPAMLRVVACADTSPARIRSWFARELEDAGWVPDLGGDPAPDSGHQTSATAWRRGDRLFVLRLLRPEVTGRYAGAAGRPADCAGGYETLVQ